jgi:hypothetical protein
MWRYAVVGAVVVSAGLLGTARAGATPVAGPPQAARTAQDAGWVRLAHLSPNTPPVDVYLYNFGNPKARLVLHHVAYGTVSPYEQLPAGDYTVSMRAAGAKPATKPVLSTAFWVSTGDAYTVAGMGPASGLRLQVLKNTLAVPGKHAMIRIIEASLKQHAVKVTFGQQVLAPKLRFAHSTPYRAVAAGSSVIRVAGSSEQATLHVSLSADTIHTLVVLDGDGHLRITDLADAAGSRVQPSGGAGTGLGGTAPRPASSPLPWLAMIGAGAALAAAAWRYRRVRVSGPRAL